GNGKLTKKLIVEAKSFSASAKKAIEDLGGEAKVIA
ncbi:MAG: mitochondrial large ribosomal subunit protein uL15m, partial [Bacilli bacterium]|nr:mitochondrial large ribosomal subunit protein uL15m [Bacilli bacterium]